MLSALLYFGVIAFGCLQESTARLSTQRSDISGVELHTINVGRVRYEDGEVTLSQNKEKPTDFFFIPFPLVDPSNSKCHVNILSGYVELSLSVELYTSQLVQTINDYLKQHFSSLCGGNKTCHVSMLPMNAIALVQKGLRTNQTREMYTVNNEWLSNAVLLRSIEFPLYTTNESICEHLLSSIVDNCYLSNFEIQYSLHPETTVERQIDVTTEQVASTSMFNRIRSQFSMFHTVALTNDDFKQFISEISEKVMLKLRAEEGFGSALQNPTILERLLNRQLSFQQAYLDQADDKLWNSLYWKRDFTRPDRLAKIINTIVRKNSTAANGYRYDSRAAKNAYRLNLTYHDTVRIDELDRLVATRAHTKLTPNGDEDLAASESYDSDSSITISTYSQYQSQESDYNYYRQYSLSRADVVKYLSELFPSIHLQGDIIVPKPIDVHLIRMNTMKSETKLFSHTVLVRTRSNIHALPLRCPLNQTMKINTTKRYRWLENKVIQLTTLINALTNQSSQCSRERKELVKRIATLEQKTEESTTKEPSQFRASKWRTHGITVAGGNGGGNQSNQLYYPCGFFLDDNKNMFIADYWNNRIVRWNYNSIDGEVIAGENERGDRYDQLNSPRDMINDEHYNSYIICDRDNRRVIRWFYHSKEHQQILVYDIDCWGLAMDRSRYIYISDWKKNEVKRWQQGESYGTIVAGGNGDGSRYDQLNYPTYIFVDEDYSVYVSDSNNHRVMKWRNGATEGVVVAGGNGAGNSGNQLTNPRGVIVDQLGQLYVADMDNHRIIFWREGDTEGSVAAGGYGQGNESYQLYRPTALAFDSEKNLYVADWGNHRIQKYESYFK